MVECFKPFLSHLVSSGRSRKTLRSHRDNLWTLGGEIISKLHEDPRLRANRPDRARGPRRRRWTAHLPRVRRSAALFRLDLPKVLSLSQRAQHGRPVGAQAMDMWTTQERCPHAHSLNNKYKSQTISQGLNRPQILPRRQSVREGGYPTSAAICGAVHKTISNKTFS
jgi:hypothetical protein